MSVTSHAQIRRFHGAAVSAGLAASRETLLAGLPSSLTTSLPSISRPAAQLLSDLSQLNDMGALPDGSIPLQIWLGNAALLAGARHEAKVFQEVLEGPREGKPRLQVVGIGAPVVLGVIALALVIHFASSSETRATDDGAPVNVPVVSVSPPAADSSSPSAAPPSASAVAGRPRSSVPTVSTPPPVSSPSAAAVTPPVCKSGVAVRTGGFWSLGIPRQELGAAQFVYLDPSPRPEALSGVHPTCSLVGSTGIAQCSRSDKAHAVPIGESVPWRAPCP